MYISIVHSSPKETQVFEKLHWGRVYFGNPGSYGDLDSKGAIIINVTQGGNQGGKDLSSSALSGGGQNCSGSTLRGGGLNFSARS